MKTLRSGGTSVHTALLPRIWERPTEHEDVGEESWGGELVCRRGSIDPSGAIVYCHAGGGSAHRRLVAELAFRSGLPVLWVTHDPSAHGEDVAPAAAAGFAWLTGLGIRPESVVLTGGSDAFTAMIDLLRAGQHPAGIVRLSPELGPDRRSLREIAAFARRIADTPNEARGQRLHGLAARLAAAKPGTAPAVMPGAPARSPLEDPFPPLPARAPAHHPGRRAHVPGQHRAGVRAHAVAPAALSAVGLS